MDDLYVPNGVAIAESGDVFVAEPAASRIARLRFGTDGALAERNIFATLISNPPGTVAPPDGICLDAAGGVWAADPVGKRVLHFDGGGGLVDEWPLRRHPLAVALGGEDRRDLYICITGSFHRTEMAGSPSGRVLVTRVETAGRRNSLTCGLQFPWSPMPNGDGARHPPMGATWDVCSAAGS